MIPQLLWIALTLFGIGFTLAKHGEPMTGTHHIGKSLLAYAITGALLYWGGFFDVLFR